MTDFFPILIMNARPGAGKSEITSYLQQIPLEERISRFHIGPMQVIDDFPLLWAWLEEDDLLERIFKRPRLHTTSDGYFKYDDMWHLLIRRLNLEYSKWCRDSDREGTVFLEFARGGEFGGYQAAYQHLSDTILQRAACLYVQVSYEESLRKNRKRYNPARPDSILEHSLDDEKMERLYRNDDWQDFSSSNPIHLTVRGIQLPYVVLENEDDITTLGGTALSERLESVLGRLWTIWQEKQKI